MFMFGDNTGIPPLAFSRINNGHSLCRLTLVKIVTKLGGHADALSRLPQPVLQSPAIVPANLQIILPAHHIKQWTSQDPVLSCVHRFIQTGWPLGDLEQKFYPYYSKQSELRIFDGCILRALHVVVPPPSPARMSRNTFGCQ